MQVNPLNTNPLNGLEAVTDTFSGFTRVVNTVRMVMRNRNDKNNDVSNGGDISYDTTVDDVEPNLTVPWR